MIEASPAAAGVPPNEVPGGSMPAARIRSPSRRRRSSATLARAAKFSSAPLPRARQVLLATS